MDKISYASSIGSKLDKDSCAQSASLITCNSPVSLPDRRAHFRVSETGNEEVMNQVDLPILDDSVCQQHYPDFLPNTELCAGYENAKKDWCAVSQTFSIIVNVI